jgi:hypothetical protein
VLNLAFTIIKQLSMVKLVNFIFKIMPHSSFVDEDT